MRGIVVRFRAGRARRRPLLHILIAATTLAFPCQARHPCPALNPPSFLTAPPASRSFPSFQTCLISSPHLALLLLHVSISRHSYLGWPQPSNLSLPPPPPPLLQHNLQLRPSGSRVNTTDIPNPPRMSLSAYLSATPNPLLLPRVLRTPRPSLPSWQPNPSLRNSHAKYRHHTQASLPLTTTTIVISFMALNFFLLQTFPRRQCLPPSLPKWKKDDGGGVSHSQCPRNPYTTPTSKPSLSLSSSSALKTKKAATRHATTGRLPPRLTFPTSTDPPSPGRSPPSGPMSTGSSGATSNGRMLTGHPTPSPSPSPRGRVLGAA